MSFDSWNSLAYWQSGEWQVIEERLKDYATKKHVYCPARDLLFRSLDLVPFGKVRCVVMGQDPYPNRDLATGIGFSVPASIRPGNLPPSLKNIFREYCSDLHYPYPSNGDLTKWCEQGVLLWNAYPSCALGKPGSHHWPEWDLITQEIVEKLDERALRDTNAQLVFVLLGRSARHFSKLIRNVPIIETSHPSPLGAKHGFLGSRIFSRVNAELCRLGGKTIDWRLDDVASGNSTSKEET